MVQCLASASALGLAVAVAAVLPELPDLACGSLRGARFVRDFRAYMSLQVMSTRPKSS